MKSITHKLSLIMALTTGLMVAAIIATNTLLLRPLAFSLSEAQFRRDYDLLVSNFGGANREFLDLIRELSPYSGANYFVLQRRPLSVVLSSTPSFTMGERLMVPVELRRYLSSQRERMGEQGAFFRPDGQLEEMRMARPPEPLSLRRPSDLVFVAPLDDDYLLLITQPGDQLGRFLGLSNRLLLIIGGLAIAMATLVAFFSARAIAKPLITLSGVADAMAGLDFSRRYRGKDRDEIGLLGRSINSIADSLSQALEELQSKNRDLEGEMALQKRFLAGVSHEFKTPVGLIRGYAESLSLGLDTGIEDRQEFTSVIVDQADRLSRLVGDVIFLARGGGHEFRIEKQSLDLVELVAKQVNAMAPLAEHQLTLVQASPGPLMVMADGPRIEQALQNLLSNALRHCAANGSVVVETKLVDAYSRCSVYNQGQGIPAEDLPRLFDPFYTAQSHRSGSDGGSGLGLSLVKAIVEAHGGRCGIENHELNQTRGVLAWFELPAV